MRVEKDGHDTWEQKVALAAGETKTVRAVLTPTKPPEPPVEGEGGHDIRGCESFRACDAFKNVAQAVRSRGAHGALTSRLADLAPEGIPEPEE